MNIPCELRAMLSELVAAERDCHEHFNRHPYRHDLEEQPADARADWSRVLRRKDAAIAALVRLGAELDIPSDAGAKAA